MPFEFERGAPLYSQFALAVDKAFHVLSGYGNIVFRPGGPRTVKDERVSDLLEKWDQTYSKKRNDQAGASALHGYGADGGRRRRRRTSALRQRQKLISSVVVIHVAIHSPIFHFFTLIRSK